MHFQVCLNANILSRRLFERLKSKVTNKVFEVYYWVLDKESFFLNNIFIFQVSGIIKMWHHFQKILSLWPNH
jgi:hypothetical protein